MVCVHCGEDTQVTNSRLQKKSNQVWRRRQCRRCGAVFTTEEAVQYDLIWLVEVKSGALKPFNRDKLFLSLYNSCQHRPGALEDATALTATIINKLSPSAVDARINSRTIARTAQVALNRFDKAASVHYQAFHKS
jgi:transcriptional repressor NrdR